MDPVVILGSDIVSVGPGQERRLPVRIRNQGRRVESFRVDVVGGPAAFSEVIPPVVSVLPGREAELDVVFRPPGGAATPTGTVPFAVRATSEVDPSSSAVAEGRLELAGVAGLQAWAPDTSRTARWSAEYQVEFANHGNAAVRLALTAHDPSGTTRLNLSPDTVDLPPAGRTTSLLRVKARQPFLRGSTVTRNLQVACQTFPFGAERPAPGGAPPQGDPNHRTFQMTFQQRPILPRFAVPLLVLALAGTVAFAVLKLRGGEPPGLTIASPAAPPRVHALELNSSEILVTWEAVPNAEGYQVQLVSIDDLPSGEDPEEPVGREQRSHRAVDLDPGTEHCFAVRALGADDRRSEQTQACATTSAESGLPTPEIEDVVPEIDGVHTVSWTYPAEIDDVEFEIFVGSTRVAEGLLGSPAPITLPQGPQEGAFEISVRAVRGTDKSEVSAPHSVTVPALPLETVSAPPASDVPDTTSEPESPTTSGAATTGEVTTVSETVPASTSGSSGAQTTISTSSSTDPATSSEPGSPSSTGDEVTDLAPTWAAVLDGFLGEVISGDSLDDRKLELEAEFAGAGVEVADMLVFSTRDTVVRDADDSTPELFREAPATSRFIYVATGTPDEAAAICAAGPPDHDCTAVELSGAARTFAGTPVLVINARDEDEDIDVVDDLVEEQRAELGWPDVYVVNGAHHPSLGFSGMLLFASDFATEGDVRTFCELRGLPRCITKSL